MLDPDQASYRKSLARTLPLLLVQFARRPGRSMADMSSKGPVGVFVLIAMFIAAGLALHLGNVKVTCRFPSLDHRATEGYAHWASQEDWRSARFIPAC